jgi:hypothetical protein
MSGLQEMMDLLLSGSLVGVPGLTQFAPLLPKNHSLCYFDGINLVSHEEARNPSTQHFQFRAFI